MPSIHWNGGRFLYSSSKLPTIGHGEGPGGSLGEKCLLFFSAFPKNLPFFMMTMIRRDIMSKSIRENMMIRSNIAKDGSEFLVEPDLEVELMYRHV